MRTSLGFDGEGLTGGVDAEAVHGVGLVRQDNVTIGNPAKRGRKGLENAISMEKKKREGKGTIKRKKKRRGG